MEDHFEALRVKAARPRRSGGAAINMMCYADGYPSGLPSSRKDPWVRAALIGGAALMLGLAISGGHKHKHKSKKVC